MSPDPYRYFRTEARELLDELAGGVLNLERAPSVELVARLLRNAHTLKGAARVVKLPVIAEHAHALEEALEPHRTRVDGVVAADIEALLGHVDAMNELMAALTPQPPAATPPSPEDPLPAMEVAALEMRELDTLLTGITEAQVELRALRRELEEIEHARHLSELLLGQLAGGARVEPQRCLATAEEIHALLGRFARRLPDTLAHAEREAEMVREVAQRLRLTPVHTIFPALERVARDASHTLGKRVELATLGGDARLDSRSLVLVRDALVQLVRNAVAHGIERTGRVRVAVGRRGKYMTFSCSDDGRGLDVVAIGRAAARRGMQPAGAGELDLDGALELLLRGGVSTSNEVSELAGRGIGLDVVREVVDALGGTVSVDSAPGRGTSFEMAIPASLSALEVLLVEAGGVVAGLPLDSVHAVQRIAPSDVLRSTHGEAVVTHDRTLALVPLSRLLQPGRSPQWLAPALSVVMLEASEGKLALGVERLLGTASVVVLPLPPSMLASPMVMGASLDAQGTPQLLLDPDALLTQALRARPSSVPVAAARRAPILVVDDSLTTRMLEQSILESAGYDVELACSAEEALVKAATRRYSLFLVDVDMPGMDGFSFVERTRSDPALSMIPAILVTSRDAVEDRERGTAVGAAAYIVKGEFDQGRLLATIAELGA